MKKKRIQELLVQARSVRNAEEASGIQVQLTEAIAGIERAVVEDDDDPIFGVNGSRDRLQSVFVRWWESGQPVTERLVEQIYVLQLPLAGQS